VRKGLYATNFGGGQVDITNGKFVFSAAEAYLIEDGKVTHPVKGATLIGNGPDALTRVSMIGNDLALDPGIGTCGKEGQSVPVGEAGLALRCTEAAQKGELKVRDATCPAIHTALQASEKGVPFMPLRGVLGSDLLKHRNDWKVVNNPLNSGTDPILLVPAIQ